MAEGARLESVYTFIAYRGFESLSLRQIKKGPNRDPFLFGGERGFDLNPSFERNEVTQTPQRSVGAPKG